MPVVGHVKNGVVIPDEEFDLPDDTKVWLVPVENGVIEVDAAARSRRLYEEARRIAAMPMEGPGSFSGRDHDKALYGAP